MALNFYVVFVFVLISGCGFAGIVLCGTVSKAADVFIVLFVRVSD